MSNVTPALAVLTMICLVPEAAGQDDVREDLARKFTRLSLQAGRTDLVVERHAEVLARSLVARAVTQGNPVPTESQRLGLQQVIEQTFRDVFPQDVWEETLFPIYAKYFTAAELAEMLDFYHTSIGSRLLNTQSQIDRESNKATQDLFRSRQAQFQAALQEALRPSNPSP